MTLYRKYRSGVRQIYKLCSQYVHK